MSTQTVIAVFCYKRAAKLRMVMESLLKNPECADMEIIFFADGAKNEKDAQGVEETRAFINQLTGFRSIRTFFREKNLSTGPNFAQGLRYLCDHYERFIVVEDDLVVSPNYIRYLLNALDHYESDKNIFCITGYCFPLRNRNYPFDTIIHHRFCSYGWASWSDRVKEVAFETEPLNEIIKKSPGFQRKLNTEGMDLYRTLRKQMQGTISTWDIQMQVHVCANNMKVVYPVVSKTSNIGFDAESTNTFGIDYLKTNMDDGNQLFFNFCHANTEAPGIRKQLRKPYGLTALAYRKVMNTLIKLTGQVKKSAIPA